METSVWGASWGASWGDSWGSSWGPLHEVEEHPERYYGGGKRRGEVDIDVVHQQWELLEQRLRNADRKAISEKAVGEEILSPDNSFSLSAEVSFPSHPDQPSISSVIDAGIEDQFKRKQKINNEAMILMLLEM